MPTLFLSYRRSEATDFVGRLYDVLQTQFGWKSVFVDLESLSSGRDFRTEIRNALDHCHVFLAIIGKNWAGEQNGIPRIAAKDDFVRIEIEAALERGIDILPVLIHEAEMPSCKVLPSTLADLCNRQAIRIDSGKDFHRHTERLLRHIEALVNRAHYDQIEGVESRKRATGSIRPTMITEDGRLILTDDGRGFIVDNQNCSLVARWAKAQKYEIVLKIRNMETGDEVGVTENVVFDAQKGDIQDRPEARNPAIRKAGGRKKTDH